MSRTLTIPLTTDGTDLGYLDWLTVCVDMEGGALDWPELTRVVQSVPLADFDPDENGDYEAVGFKDAVVEAFTGLGYTVVFADVGKIVWPIASPLA